MEEIPADSFDPIRESAEGNVAIMLRMLGALQTIASGQREDPPAVGLVGGAARTKVWIQARAPGSLPKIAPITAPVAANCRA